MQAPDNFDVVIIGGGLAGSSAGFHLASHGYKVALVEREAQAHHKICGEFLSQETVSYLDELGIDFDSLKASSINAFSLYSSQFNTKSLFSSPARGLSRYVLDEACLEKARAAGCFLFRGEEIQKYERDEEENFILRTPQRVLKSKTLFLANGKHEFKRLNTRKGLESSAIGFKMHYRLTEQAAQKLKNDIALFFFEGGYGGFCKIEGNVANFCFIIDKNTFKKSAHHYENLLQTLQKQNSHLKDLLQEASPLWSKPLVMSGVPYGHLLEPSSLIEKGVFPLGDQFAVIPSLTGSGMAIALYTAKNAFLNFHEKGNQGLNSYIQQCLTTLKPRMRLAYPFHALTRSPSFANLALMLLKIFPFLAKQLLQKTRIPFLKASNAKLRISLTKKSYLA